MIDIIIQYQHWSISTLNHNLNVFTCTHRSNVPWERILWRWEIQMLTSYILNYQLIKCWCVRTPYHMSTYTQYTTTQFNIRYMFSNYYDDAIAGFFFHSLLVSFYTIFILFFNIFIFTCVILSSVTSIKIPLFDSSIY